MSASPTAITREQVRHLADLARIDLEDAELDHLAPQLSVILESVASISAIAADDIEPTSHALPLTNVFRDDVVVPSLSAEAALSGAPQVEEQRFAVPKILGKSDYPFCSPVGCRPRIWRNHQRAGD